MGRFGMGQDRELISENIKLKQKDLQSEQIMKPFNDFFHLSIQIQETLRADFPSWTKFF